jgi:Domain of Unknown Function (DUF928)
MVLAFYPGGLTKAVGQNIEPPPGQGSPNGTVGGGSRTSSSFCVQSPQVTDRLTALSPTQKVAYAPIDCRDSWIYLPKAMAQRVELSLPDGDMNGIYQTTLPIPKKAGLMSLRLPAEAPLKQNQPYYSVATLGCNQSDRTEHWGVGGWIQRTGLGLLAKGKLVSAEVGNSSLTETQQIELDNSYFTNAWAMLKSLELEKVVAEAIASPSR